MNPLAPEFHMPPLDLAPAQQTYEYGGQQEQEFAQLEMSGAAAFVIKTYQLISTCDPNLGGWSDDNETLEIRNKRLFEKQELPKYFDCSYNSFARQLNFYGFKKLPQSTQGLYRFVNENFKRGRVDLLQKIQRSTKKGGDVNMQARDLQTLKERVESLEDAAANLKCDHDDLKQKIEHLMRNSQVNPTPMAAATIKKSKYPQPTLAPHPATQTSIGLQDMSAPPLPERNLGDRQWTLSDLDGFLESDLGPDRLPSAMLETFASPMGEAKHS
ncbi:hypothetical protein CTEN210_12643 [Chaetoceros tenuissimus]|uniref:HSF-type DNA-binding domain-containing protein n=1 Tax=Chaetoceros tenuissimus TaxID=426638 RepID=A0AAD3D216_9STRA|nr:hypothetical protein CTEN210_12643 [Chaetoceros tenuissimus]